MNSLNYVLTWVVWWWNVEDFCLFLLTFSTMRLGLLSFFLSHNIIMGAKLFFYYSAMNAGKSTTLLQADFNYKEQGMKTVLLTPSVDTRAGEGVIKSRLGIESKADCFDKECDLL